MQQLSSLGLTWIQQQVSNEDSFLLRLTYSSELQNEPLRHPSRFNVFSVFVYLCIIILANANMTQHVYELYFPWNPPLFGIWKYWNRSLRWHKSVDVVLLFPDASPPSLVWPDCCLVCDSCVCGSSLDSYSTPVPFILSIKSIDHSIKVVPESQFPHCSWPFWGNAEGFAFLDEVILDYSRLEVIDGGWWIWSSVHHLVGRSQEDAARPENVYVVKEPERISPRSWASHHARSSQVWWTRRETETVFEPRSHIATAALKATRRDTCLIGSCFQSI